MEASKFDLTIMGAGPGGYVGAIYAAQRGLKVALVEGREVGGVCLHAGCIPTKTLVASVDLLRQLKTATQRGLGSASGETSFSVLQERRKRVVNQLTQGVKFLLNKQGVQIFHGWGSFLDRHTISIHDPTGGMEVGRLESPAIMIATGSKSSNLRGLACDGVAILHSGDMLSLMQCPKHLIIIGGGYIGCEFAGILSALGGEVTVLEAQGRLLPGMDAELGQTLDRVFRKAGIKVVLNAQVKSVKHGEMVRVDLEDGTHWEADKVLVSVGRVAHTEGLGLEAAGVALNGTAVAVNEHLETNVPGIYAVGDVTGKMPLAHVASAQARYVVDRILIGLGRVSAIQEPGGAMASRTGFDYGAVPACVFTSPEIASVGLTESEAKEKGMSVRTSRFPFSACGKAVAIGETEGFVKLVAEEQSGRVVGGQILGPHATELIGQVTLAVRARLTAGQLCETIFAHPTLAEAIHEAAEGLFGQPIHSIGRPRPVSAAGSPPS
ncbi:MAG TPA: dihydrolipoyl dehydrogenase [Candidatus Paceibacterota bacterium]|nr:dihydrolipoyl dehydrogenase [Verrucomicrobiota bacterium]HRY48617.1 dihydrolipoyl dehydrogenase [Candidatus Paceibacterota bacterium]